MNLFEPTAAQEIVSRLQNVTASTPANWGKMNAAQMMAHCRSGFQAYFGEIKMKRGLIGLLFGRIALKKLLSDKPWSRNMPTAPQFKVRDEKEFNAEREKLLTYVNRFAKEGHSSATNHPFFGKMTPEQWGVFMYKHMDHHLKQFGV